MRLVSAPKYFKYPECNSGDVLVKKGKYLETKEGKFGAQHYFEELESGERICLNSAGQLNYLVDAHLVEGTVCGIIYKGKVELTSGAMAGKSAHNFDLLLEEVGQTTTPQTSTSDLE